MGAEVAVSLAWPTTAEGLRVWGAVLLAWVLATYFVAGNSPIIERIGAHPAPGPHPSWKRRAYARAPALLILLLLILTPRNAGLWALLAALPRSGSRSPGWASSREAGRRSCAASWRSAMLACTSEAPATRPSRLTWPNTTGDESLALSNASSWQRW